MGLDLWLSMSFVAAVSGLAFVAGRRLPMSVHNNRAFLLAECLIFSLVFAFGLLGRLFWAETLPVSAAVCWSNWMPIFLAFTAGISTQASCLHRSRRWIASAGFCALAIGFFSLPVLRPAISPVALSRTAMWENGICLQSNEASCGPAAAATLLRQAGVLNRIDFSNVMEAPDDAPPSHEAALAKLCLTSNQGTAPLGLYRGLQIAAASTDRVARVASDNPSSWGRLNQLPNVAIVRFDLDTAANPVQRLLGRGDDAHAIVIHSRTRDGQWLIADPASGWIRWTDEQLLDVFTGEAIYLDTRTASPASRHHRVAGI